MKHFFRKADNESHNFWMSYTDLMSGFLIVFIIASIIYFNRSNEIAKLVDGVPIDDIKEWLKERQTNATLVNVNKDFEQVFNDIKGIKIDTIVGSIRVYPTNNEKELFKKGSDTMELNLRTRLDLFGRNFVEKAMSLVNDEHKDIQEIRIEGHTDSDADFIYNLDLSSRRARAVYAYIHDCCGLTREEIRFMEDKMIAVGYSEARLIDDKGELIGTSSQSENKDNSRRIEFRIIGKDKYLKKAETNQN